MANVHENNYISTVAANIDAIQTNIDISSDTNFPPIGPGDTCKITLDNGVDIEIVLVTSKVGLTLTVIRGQENTVGTAFNAGTKVEQRLTADTIDDKLSRTLDFIDDDSFLSASPVTAASSESIKNYVDAFNLQLLKGFATFDQSAGVSVLESLNVSSISDDGAGLSTVTLTNSMATANYIVVGMHESTGINNVGSSGYVPGGVVTTSSFQLETAKDNGDGIDSSRVSFIVCGDQ